MQKTTNGLNFINNGKIIIFFLSSITVLVICIAVFIYFHPHVPITLPDATICNAYKIKSEDEIVEEWVSSGLHPSGSRPNLTSAIYGKKLDQYRWISLGPVNCDEKTFLDIKAKISDPWIYERLKMEGTIFSPQYAYKLSGSSGSEVILIDIRKGMFEIEKFDAKGAMVIDSDVIQCDHRRTADRQWLFHWKRHFQTTRS